MRVYEIQQAFGLENLVMTERPEPAPGHGQVRVRVHAASLNYRDLMMIEGRYNPRQKLPLVPLSDGVGVIDAVGPGVTRAKVGDRVAGNFAQGWLAGAPTRAKSMTTLGGPLDGMLAERVVLSEEGVVHVPAYLTDEEAATLPCAALTAWSALVTQGHLRAGETVLVQGTGGVSIFALQFAKLHGARVVVTSSSDEKLARARALGAHETINYVQQPDWHKEARRLTDGLGVDHVVEVGGGGTFGKALQCVKPGGTVSVIGVLAGTTTEVSLTAILMQNVRVQGVLVGDREGFEAMNRAITLAGLRPVVDRVFAFEQAREALEHMKRGAHFGKLCVRVAPAAA